MSIEPFLMFYRSESVLNCRCTRANSLSNNEFAELGQGWAIVTGKLGFHMGTHKLSAPPTVSYSISLVASDLSDACYIIQVLRFRNYSASIKPTQELPVSSLLH